MREGGCGGVGMLVMRAVAIENMEFIGKWLWYFCDNRWFKSNCTYTLNIYKKKWGDVGRNSNNVAYVLAKEASAKFLDMALLEDVPNFFVCCK